MYNAFISYRKTSSVNADFIRKSIADNSVFSTDDIFLDKHNIGPELFNEKIEKAISESKCVVLLVTNNCFKPKEDGKEDWFLKEIKTAIAQKKKIIPILFDGIDSLSETTIIVELNKSFTHQEVEILTKTQGIPYSTDFPDASIKKLVAFVEETNTSNGGLEMLLKTIKVIGIIIAVLFAFFVAFFGLGVLWGYFTSSSENESVLVDNTIINGSSLHFEYEGWNATYNLDNDSIVIELEEYNNKPKVGNVDLALASFTYTGAKVILDKNLSYLKYVKFLKGGSKQSKIAFLCASAVVCVGAFCGFSQGSSFGRAKKQEETALMLYPKLQKRSTWKPLLKDNIFLIRKFNWWEWAKAPNGISIGSPQDSTCIAFKKGITVPMVLLKYNNWEIGYKGYMDLMKEIEDAKDKEKDFVFLNMQDLTVAAFHMPRGTVGILFRPGDGNQGRYEIAKEKFLEWKKSYPTHKGD